MKRITTIVLFASIFAVAVGTLGLSGNSSALMISAVPQTSGNMVILGHVEYTLLDEAGSIKAYLQSDNEVVVAGKDCAATHLFSTGLTGVGTCINNPGAFSYIGIGNGSINVVGPGEERIGPLNATLADSLVGDGDTTATCADDGSGNSAADGGDMARRNVTATFNTAGTTTIVTLDTSDTSLGQGGPFTFVAANATSVTDSGLFNGDYTNGPDTATHTCGASEGAADAANANGGWNMFSRQLLNDETGITVSDGDSLSVKWTITIG